MLGDFVSAVVTQRLAHLSLFAVSSFSGISIMKHSTVDVAVRQGWLRGIVEENIHGGEYIAFRGIPYAKPPVGELRFKDPVPPEPWSGFRDASEFGNIASQIDIFITQQLVGEEDCLYLNVYTKMMKPKTKLPVMVWIHGGGFVYGAGNDDLYGPDHIIQKDVVLVTFNYRLGIFGFLYLDDEIAPGNQGLKDMVMALRWVQENISNFGGDPENVTIFGESAGGAAVHYLTLSPMANGLYHKAIAQSGLVLCPWALTESTKKSFLIAEKLGIKTSDPKIAYDFLRTMDAKKLIEAQQSLTSLVADQQLLIPFVPNVDANSPNPFLIQHPATSMRFGVKVPFLFGCNSHEGNMFQRKINSKALQKVDSDFKTIIHPKVQVEMKQRSISMKLLRSLYFDNKPVSMETLKNHADILSDIHFNYPLYEIADIQMQQGHPSSYMYKFSYDCGTSLFKEMMDIKLPGAAHGEELLYLFHPSILTAMDPNSLDRNSANYKIINQLTQLWTDFAKTGNPTPVVTDLIPITWTPLKSGNDSFNYLNIDSKLRMETIKKEEQRLDWKIKHIKHKL